MDRAELEQKSVGDLRKLMRERHPQTRGAFAAQANKSQCVAVLVGDKSPAEVMDAWFEKGRSLAPGVETEPVEPDERAGDGAVTPDEGVGGENPPPDGEAHVTRDAAQGATQGQADGDALSKGLNVLRAAGMDEAVSAIKGTQRKLSHIEAGAKAEINKLQAECGRLKRERRELAQARRDASTDLKAENGEVKVAGVRCFVMEPDLKPLGAGESCPECGAVGDHGAAKATGAACANPALAYVPAMDEHYRFDVWRAQRQCGALTFRQDAADLIAMLKRDQRLLLVGPPATGKTSVVEQFAARVRWPVTRFNGNRDVTVQDFVGCYEAAGGATRWVDGPLPRAMREGHLLILDEVDHMPAECSSVLHSVLERGGRLLITANGGEVVKPHIRFRIVATANTAGFGDEHGVHPNAQVQDAAFMSRFDAVFSVAHLAAAAERDLLMVRTGVDKAQAEALVKVAGDTRDSAEAGEILTPVTLRQTLAWADLIATGMDVGNAMALAVLNKVSETDVGAIAEIAQRHLGEALGGQITDSDSTQ